MKQSLSNRRAQEMPNHRDGATPELGEHKDQGTSYRKAGRNRVRRPEGASQH
jgi:hypothetical protein